jgi:hypothetical protein
LFAEYSILKNLTGRMASGLFFLKILDSTLRHLHGKRTTMAKIKPSLLLAACALAFSSAALAAPEVSKDACSRFWTAGA